MVERSVEIKKRAVIAFKAGDFATAKSLSEQLLGMVDQLKGNWNYGNTIHVDNIILGRIALRSGNVEIAKEHLYYHLEELISNEQ
jgi:hypothetical protein